MRRSLAILLTIMCALCFAGPVNVNAGTLVGSGSCGDDAYWKLNSDGEMFIYGSGATYDYSYDSYNSKPWKNYSSQIKKVIIVDGITKVGAYLFYGSPIQSVEFNNTNNLVIGQNAFAESSLTDINFGSGTITVSKNAFSDCNSLEYVDVTENIVMDGNKQSSEEGSGDQLFYSCANLKSATVSCANVGRYMFESCYNLENVTFSNPDTKFYCLEGGFQNGYLRGHPFNSNASGTWEVNIIAPECSQAHRLAEVGNINSTSLSYTQIEGDETSHSGGTATCTDEAICTKCGMPYGTSLGHVYGDLIEKQPATCTEDGMEAHYCCSACNWFFDSNKQRTTEEALTIKAAHEWNDDYTVDKAPSCTEKGSQSIHCKNCDATKDSEEIKETGHSWEDIAIHPATPNESGYTAYKRCSVCEDTSGGEAIAQIDAQTLTLSEDEYTYDGEAKTPSVSVKDMDGIALTAGTDYTVSYKDNKAAGIATAVVEFKDNYDGTLEKQFTILSRGTTDLVFELDETEVEFDGTAKTPGIVIRDENGTLLVEDEDYTVSYQNNTNPGTGKIIITFSDNYGGAEAVREFEIVCKHSTEEHITPATFEADGNIDNVCSKCKETISSTVIPAPIPVIGETELLYNGEKQTPEVSIAGLEEGKDYIIEWPEESTEAGTYSGTIRLTGEKYSGTKIIEYNITEDNWKDATKYEPGTIEDFKLVDSSGEETNLLSITLKTEGTLTGTHFEVSADPEYAKDFHNDYFVWENDDCYLLIKVFSGDGNAGEAPEREGKVNLLEYEYAPDFDNGKINVTYANNVLELDPTDIKDGELPFYLAYLGPESFCAHDVKETIETKASFDSDGSIKRECSRCEEKIFVSKTIAKPVAEITCTEFEYDGEKHVPEVTIEGLEEGKDYTIEWPEESTKPGNYTGTIKLTGDRYSGEKTVEFSISELRSIVPKDTTIKVRVGKTRQIELDEVYGDVTYKTANKKIVTVSSTGKLKGIKKGTTTVTVTATGDESHNPATVDITVIVPTVITKAALKSTSASYDGNVHMPVVKSVNGSTTTAKKEGIYRTYITDADGNEVTEPVDAGKYYLVVEAIGTYDGTVKKAYTINPAAQTINIESGTKATIYKGKADYELNASSEQGGEISYKVTSGTSYASLADGHFVHAKKAGKATVTVTAASVGNYKATTKKITITVKNPAKLSTSNITVPNCAYTGSPVEPEVTVKNANAGEYTVSYSSNEAIGTATVTVTPKAECQPYTETAVNKTFKILPEGTSITLEAAAKSFTATWEVPATAEKSEMTGYKIRYSTSSKMSKPKTITIKDPAATEKTVASLLKAKTYYVQICTYKTIGKTTYASPWSETVKVKTL